jgi:hypothetical protein
MQRWQVTPPQSGRGAGGAGGGGGRQGEGQLVDKLFGSFSLSGYLGQPVLGVGIDTDDGVGVCQGGRHGQGQLVLHQQVGVGSAVV